MEKGNTAGWWVPRALEWVYRCQPLIGPSYHQQQGHSFCSRLLFCFVCSYCSDWPFSKGRNGCSVGKEAYSPPAWMDKEISSSGLYAVSSGCDKMSKGEFLFWGIYALS